jgi:cation diffusion facilitator family transporter
MNDCGCGSTEAETQAQRRVLWIALGLNAAMFVVEVGAGLTAHSTGLIADGLDLLSDATAYAIGLAAVGRSNRFKANAANSTGTLLFLLGLGVLFEVVRRAISGEPPEGGLMIAVSTMALAVNATVLTMLSKQRAPEVHIHATYICTRADVVANAAVIVSGIAVLATGWRFADLVVGAGIGLYVVREALEILIETRAAKSRA